MKIGVGVKKAKASPTSITAVEPKPPEVPVLVGPFASPQVAFDETSFRTLNTASLDQLGAFLAQSEASLHVSYREGKFLVVGHRAKDDRCMDVTTPDLAAGLRMFVEEMSK